MTEYKGFIFIGSSFQAAKNVHDQIIRDYKNGVKDAININRARNIQNFLRALKQLATSSQINISSTPEAAILSAIDQNLYKEIVKTLNLTNLFSTTQWNNSNDIGAYFEKLITDIFNELSTSDNIFNNGFLNTGPVSGTTSEPYAGLIRQELSHFPLIESYSKDLQEKIMTYIYKKAHDRLSNEIQIEVNKDKLTPKQIKADVATASTKALRINAKYDSSDNLNQVIRDLQASTFSLKSYKRDSVKFGITDFYKVMMGVTQGLGSSGMSPKTKAQTDAGLAKFIYYAGEEVLNLPPKHHRRTNFPQARVDALKAHLYSLQIIYEITGRGLHVTDNKYLNIDGREVEFIIYYDRRKNGDINVIPADAVINKIIEQNTKNPKRIPNVYTRSKNSEYTLSGNILASLAPSIL